MTRDTGYPTKIHVTAHAVERLQTRGRVIRGGNVFAYLESAILCWWHERRPIIDDGHDRLLVPVDEGQTLWAVVREEMLGVAEFVCLSVVTSGMVDRAFGSMKYRKPSELVGPAGPPKPKARIFGRTLGGTELRWLVDADRAEAKVAELRARPDMDPDGFEVRPITAVKGAA